MINGESGDGGHGLPNWRVSLSLTPADPLHIDPPPQGTWYLVITLTAHTSEPGAIWGLGRALVCSFPGESSF